jgi:hypothetical protein
VNPKTVRHEPRMCFKTGWPRMFTLLPHGGATADGKHKYPPSIISISIMWTTLLFTRIGNFVLNYGRSSETHLSHEVPTALHSLRGCDPVYSCRRSPTFRGNLFSPSSGSESKSSNQQEENIWLGLLPHLDDGGNIFMRNVGELLPDYTASQPRRQYSL